MEDRLPQLLESIARLKIAKAGTVTGARQKLDLVEGTNVAITLADDSVNEKVTATFAVASAAPSGTAGGDLTGTYPNPTIGALKVLTAAINDLAVTTGKLAANAVTAAKLDVTLPQGWVAGSTPQTSAQLTIGTTTDITGTSITWTAVANRKYLYVPQNVSLTPSTIGDRWVIKILLDGIQIGTAGILGVAAASEDFMAPGLLRFSAAAGSHTIKLQTSLTAGTGTLTANGTATSPISANIFDMGGT